MLILQDCNYVYTKLKEHNYNFIVIVFTKWNYRNYTVFCASRNTGQKIFNLLVEKPVSEFKEKSMLIFV
jgi:hypothetical protein